MIKGKKRQPSETQLTETLTVRANMMDDRYMMYERYMRYIRYMMYEKCVKYVVCVMCCMKGRGCGSQEEQHYST